MDYNFLPTVIFGQYTPIAGQTGIAAVDFSYILNVFVFCIILQFLFRLVLSFFRR